MWVTKMTDDKKLLKKSTTYIPLKTLTGFIERLSATVVPSIIDGSLLSTMSGSMKSQLMSALRFMGLIKINGAVNEKLKKLVDAYNTDTWKTTFAEIINESYAEVIGDVNLSTGTAQQLNEAFRLRGGVDGQMLEKAVRFYLAALAECDIKVSPHFTAKRARKTTPRKKSKKKSTNQEQEPGSFADFDIGEEDSGMAKFHIPIPGKRNGIIVIPDDINQGDWDMVKIMLDAYIARLTSSKEN